MLEPKTRGERTSKVAARDHPLKRLLREHHLREVRQMPHVRDVERPVDLEGRTDIPDHVDLGHVHATQRLTVPLDRQTLWERNLRIDYHACQQTNTQQDTDTESTHKDLRS